MPDGGPSPGVQMTDGVTTEARTEQHSATRYVDAARDLASGTAGAGFTVQQVVREAGGSDVPHCREA